MFLSCILSNSASSSIQTSNQNPIVSLFGIPSPVSQQQQEYPFSFRYSLASNFVQKVSTDELLILDGETGRFEIDYFRQLDKYFSVAINIPILKHGGGFLDTFVDDWHHFFSLPDSGRPLSPANRLLYQYQVDGENLINQTKGVSGLGDIGLSGLYRLKSTQSYETYIRTGFKLPSGDPKSLLGSGGIGTYFDLHRFGKQANSIWTSHTSVGVLFMMGSDLLSNQRHQAIYGSAALTWYVTDNLSLDIQLMGHTGFVDSQIRVLDGLSFQLTFGGRIKLTDSVEILFALSEDPIVGASPDVVFHFGISSQF